MLGLIVSIMVIGFIAGLLGSWSPASNPCR